MKHVPIPYIDRCSGHDLEFSPADFYHLIREYINKNHPNCCMANMAENPKTSEDFAKIKELILSFERSCTHHFKEAFEAHQEFLDRKSDAVDKAFLERKKRQ